MGKVFNSHYNRVPHVSTAKASTVPPSWASGNAAVTIVFGDNTIAVHVAAILQENTGCEPQTGYTRNVSHCRLTLGGSRLI